MNQCIKKSINPTSTLERGIKERREIKMQIIRKRQADEQKDLGMRGKQKDKQRACDEDSRQMEMYKKDNRKAKDRQSYIMRESKTKSRKQGERMSAIKQGNRKQHTRTWGKQVQ